MVIHSMDSAAHPLNKWNFWIFNHQNVVVIMFTCSEHPFAVSKQTDSSQQGTEEEGKKAKYICSIGEHTMQGEPWKY